MKRRLHHPYVSELAEQYEKGKLSRREFLRSALLLGVSAGVASTMVGLPRPRGLYAAQPQRGGRLRISGSVHRITHPAKFSWVGPSNQMRQVGEYLTWTDGHNLTHPYLLESWETSEDLKTWTLHLRQGIKFNNGDLFTADDVVFTLNQWLDKNVGSSVLGLMGYMDPTGIEKTDQYQVKLHLTSPEIAVPEHLFHYPAIVLNHRTFEGDFIQRPHGTGPYTVERYVEGERCLLKRRSDYWQIGADGQSLPYMDGMEFIDMGADMAPQFDAMAAGEIDMIDLSDAGGLETFAVLKDEPNVNLIPAASAGAWVLRMRVDRKPWDDNRVRTALKICQHREKILALTYLNQGLAGHDFHIFPLHPEYCEKPLPKYDPERAKELLTEAGYPNGLDVTLAVGSDWTEVVRYAELLRGGAALAGIRVNAHTMPTSHYRQNWTEFDLGITPWMHRPLGTITLNLAYVTDNEGKPVPWNETRWVDEEFSKLLKQANGILEVDERRKVFCDLEDIQMERGSIGIAFWRNQWYVTSRRVEGVKGHPSLYILFNDVWLKQAEEDASEA
jgi:peptide/nickel transport system substrate-binding protein